MRFQVLLRLLGLRCRGDCDACGSAGPGIAPQDSRSSLYEGTVRSHPMCCTIYSDCRRFIRTLFPVFAIYTPFQLCTGSCNFACNAGRYPGPGFTLAYWSHWRLFDFRAGMASARSLWPTLRREQKANAPPSREKRGIVCLRACAISM